MVIDEISNVINNAQCQSLDKVCSNSLAQYLVCNNHHCLLKCTLFALGCLEQNLVYNFDVLQPIKQIIFSVLT